MVQFMKMHEFCDWLKEFDFHNDEIAYIHTGHTLELELIEPIVEHTIGMSVVKSATKTTFVPENDEAYAEYYVPSILDFSKKYVFFVAYKRPFWVVVRRADEK